MPRRVRGCLFHACLQVEKVSLVRATLTEQSLCAAALRRLRHSHWPHLHWTQATPHANIAIPATHSCHSHLHYLLLPLGRPPHTRLSSCCCLHDLLRLSTLSAPLASPAPHPLPTRLLAMATIIPRVAGRSALALTWLTVVLSCLASLTVIVAQISVSGKSGDSTVQALIGAGSLRAPFFSLTFPTSPSAVTNQFPAYNWQNFDPIDSSSIIGFHQGVIQLSGASTSYIDLNTNNSPNSAGYVLPAFGGAGFYPYGSPSQGWSFECVFKFPNAPATSGTWPKVFFLGNGAGVDDVVLTWDGNNYGRLGFQMYSASAAFPMYNYAFKDFMSYPVANQWYHVVAVVQAVNPQQGSGNWFVYVNGQQLNYTGGIVPGSFYNYVQGALTPQNVSRTQSYLGKSDFGDPNAAVTIDAFRVWDYALTPALVQQLAAAYNLNIPPTVNSSIAYNDNGEVAAAATAVLPGNPAIFSATFPVNPATYVGGTTAYAWAAQEPLDSTAVANLHKGVVMLYGASNQYIDLTTTYGPQSCGLLLPVFGGAGSGTYGVNQGLTFELVVKFYVTELWAKLFNFGTGGGVDTMGVTWNGNSGALEGSLEVQNYNQAATQYLPYGGSTVSQLPFLSPVLNAWYHIAVVMLNTDPVTYTNATYSVYVNGQLVASMINGTLPLAVYRPYSYIAGSDWGDAPAEMALDAFRIYDYALSVTQVQSLAGMYQLNGVVPTPTGTVSYPFPLMPEDVAALGAVPVPPLFSASFSTNPASAVSTPAALLNYNWLQNDPNDTVQAVQQAHTGLIAITTSAQSFIDLNTALGPNSVGLVLPVIGGPGLYPYGQPLSGWTFEVVVKFTQYPSSGSWAKLFFLGNGMEVDDIIISWNGNDVNTLGLQMYSNATTFPQYQYGFAEFLKPVVGQWYHIVWTVQAAPVPGVASTNLTAGAGVWNVWVNGQLLNWAALVNNGGSTVYPSAIYTPVQGALYPQAVPRGQSYIGKSDFGDTNLALILDAFRIYNYTLNQQQVTNLATAYNLVVPNPSWPIPASQPVQATTETTNYVGITAQAPVFNAVFGQNPAQYVGGVTNYQWMNNDTADSPALQALHQGILVLNGSSSLAYVDVSTPTGPQSIGLVMPILCSQAGVGCTIEMVIKLTAYSTWQKVFDFGTGGYSDSLAMTWNGNNALYQMEIQNYNKVPGFSSSSNDPAAQLVFLTPQIGQWYHIALVMTPTGATSAYTSLWQVYVNGQLAATGNGQQPMPVYRNDAYIGGSNWMDAPIACYYDEFRVYNYALSAAELVGLATVYGLYQNVTGSSTAGLADAAVNAMIAGGVRAPMFNLTFNVNPSTITGQFPAYNWENSDPTDSASIVNYHQGVIQLSGASTSYIDLNTNNSPNSAGYVLPAFGGAGFYPYGSPSQGWSFECVFKFPNAPATSGTWPKVFFLGNGAGVDDVVLTWDGNNYGRLGFQMYSASAAFPMYDYAFKDFMSYPVANQWYHVVAVVQAVNPQQGSGNWFVYVNGQQLNYTGGIVPGSFYNYVQGALTPQNVSRTQSYLGKSDFGDPNAAVTIDAFRVWDYALTPALVQQLAAAYNLNIPPTVNSSIAYNDNGEVAAAATAVLPGNPAIFSATFPVNPATYVGGTTAYAWAAQEPLDSTAVANLHKGVVMLYGASNQYIDLTTTYGPQSCGLLLPVFGGAGSGTYGVNQGLTFELVVKFYVTELWAKLFNFGTGGGVDTMGVTWNGNSGALEGSLEVQNYNQAATQYLPYGGSTVSQLPFLSPVLNAWYHIAVVMLNTDPVTYTNATYSVYVNGQLVASMINGTLPLAVYRPYSYIAGSDWGDAPAEMALDAFRIYDYALSVTQVQSLAGMYQLNGVVPTPTGTVSYPFPLMPEDVAALGAVPVPPLFSASFSTNPASAVSTPAALLNYNWLQNDPNDTVQAVQQAHTGLIAITTSAQSFIDLNTALGPNSVGLVLPVIGGPGLYPYGQPLSGWTFEVVVKFTQYPSSGSWAKLFFLGNGMEVDDIIISWNGNDVNTLGLQMYSNATTFPQYQYGFAEFLKPVVGQWYHIVWTVQAAPVPGVASTNLTAGAGVWNVWVNGQLLNWAALVNNGGSTVYPSAIYTPVQGALYPQAVPRGQSYIGKSDFGDTNLALILDAFRIYNYTLNQQQVTNLATAYNLVVPNPSWPIPASQPVQATTETTNYVGITAQAPVFNAVFGQNPAQYVGGVTNYQWMNNDTADSPALQALHQGILVLNGSSSLAYVDVSTPTGPQSIGLVMPILCSQAGVGCTIEMVIKLTAYSTWQKVFDFGTGGYSDSLAMTWNGNNALYQMEIQNYNKVPGFSSSSNDPAAQLVFLTPQIGQWYHIALVMTPTGATSAYTSLWQVYVNGQLAATGNGQQPMPVYRNDAYIGGSNWMDAPIACYYDEFRVYNYALSATEITGLATVYGVNTYSAPPSAPPAASSSSSASPTPTTSSTGVASSTAAAPSPTSASPTSAPASSSARQAPPTSSSVVPPPVYVTSPSSATTSPSPTPSSSAPSPPPSISSSSTGSTIVVGSSSSSSLSGGAIAGIVIGAVVGAALLCLVCFFAFCFKRSDKQDQPAESPKRRMEQMGNRVGKGYGQMEHSTAASSMADTTAEHSTVDPGVEMAEVHGEPVTA